MTTIVPEMPGGGSSRMSPTPRIEEYEAEAPTELATTVEQMAPTRTAQWDGSTKRMVLVVLLVLAAFAISLSSSILPMLIIASIVAYLLNPIVDLGERLRIPRSVTTIVLFVLLLIGLILLPILLVPVLIDELTRLGQFNQSAIAANFLHWLSGRLSNFPETVFVLGRPILIGRTIQELETNFQQFIVVPTLAE